MLELCGISKRLGRRSVLDDVSLSCPPGEITAVVGENGAGKSTLLRIATGILEPDRGRVLVGGEELSAGGVTARRQLGYVPDSSEPLPDLMVCELFALTAALKRLPRPGEDWPWIERLGVRPIWRQRLSTLSFGERKRALVLCAQLGEPAVLVLDEPSNGLDPGGATLMAEILRERARAGRATLLASNDAPFLAALASSAFRLGGGRLERCTD